MKHPTSKIRHPTSSWLRAAKAKAAVNAPQSRRFAEYGNARQSRSVWTAVALAPLWALMLTLNASFAADTNSVFLFTFFREPNGQAGLFLATSTNGLNWAELKAPSGKSFLEPHVGGKLMRDPCLQRGPDGVFHLVWTTSWGRPPVFGYASSTDLVHWSEERAIPVMENDPTAQNVWAPELFYDAVKQQWLIFWATTIPGKFPETENSGDNNHRIYYVTTKDFTNFSPTKLLYDGGFNVIDATMLVADGKYLLIVKDETKNPLKKDLHITIGDSAEGPFGVASPAISTNWVEGPTAVKIGGEYYIYFDHYGNPKYYGAIKSTDLKTWQDISPSLSFPKGIRHGTVLTVPDSIVQQIQNHQ
jgi:beta-xylosidase